MCSHEHAHHHPMRSGNLGLVDRRLRQAQPLLEVSERPFERSVCTPGRGLRCSPAVIARVGTLATFVVQALHDGATRRRRTTASVRFPFHRLPDRGGVEVALLIGCGRLYP